MTPPTIASSDLPRHPPAGAALYAFNEFLQT